MFERFTTPARGVIVEAQQQAHRLTNPFIGTEHLLLAMLRPEGGIAYTLLTQGGLDLTTTTESVIQLQKRHGNPAAPDLGDDDAAALEAIGIDLHAIRAKLEESFGPGALDTPPPTPARGFLRRKKRIGGHLPLTSRAKKALELSLREAIAMHHNYIGVEHLLLGLLREGHGIGSQVIRDAGLDPTALRTAIVAALPKAA